MVDLVHVALAHDMAGWARTLLVRYVYRAAVAVACRPWPRIRDWCMAD